MIFFALTAACVFAFRRQHRTGAQAEGFRIPGHPLTTLFFIAACCAVAFSTIYAFPHNSLVGLAIMFSGLPVYFGWVRMKTERKVKGR